MAQQTAIEWLVNWSKENPLAFQSDYYEAIEQAKAMEKIEIEASYIRGSVDSIGLKSLKIVTLAEQYYNETYSNGKKD